jgi:hypothetical protein
MDVPRALAVIVVSGLALGAEVPSPHTLVVCAPGYPGSTEQARPTMAAFAARLEAEAGWPAGSLEAVYFETSESGVSAMEQPAAALALAPLSFVVEFGSRLGLEPRLAAVPKPGPTEVWTLVAGRGRVSGPASLQGWTVASRAGYAPGFVRRVVLEGWELPPTAVVSFTPRVVSDLRKAAAGEKVAVLLDGEQSAALDSLPFAGDLETVFRSRPLVTFVLCVIEDRLARERADGLLRALLQLDESAGGVSILEEIRLMRFEPLDPKVVDRISLARQQVAGAGS